MIANRYFSYIRVSTARQGQTSTSLTEQKAAIKRYAKKYNLEVSQQFQEQETAAKRGRPIFNQMLKELKQGKAQGVIIHKIDRSARNLKDWADIGELIDQGVKVHFAHESLDLHSRGGRLAADIQAVVATDYIRNLREETKKGFYGRLKQGISPMPAPVGYLDCGKGKSKEPDPIQSVFIRKAFELYATGDFGLNTLRDRLYQLGLRTKRGTKVSRNGLSCILHNPFYTGIIRIKSTNQEFQGKHIPIIPTHLFNQVQEVLQGKNIAKPRKHSFLFRRLVVCASCSRRLTGEYHKGYVYYRCHTPLCPQKSIREEVITSSFLEMFNNMRLPEDKKSVIRAYLQKQYQQLLMLRQKNLRIYNLQLRKITGHLEQLANEFMAGRLTPAVYAEQKASLLSSSQIIQGNIEDAGKGAEQFLQRVEQFFILLENPAAHFAYLPLEKRREVVQLLAASFVAEKKKVSLNYAPVVEILLGQTNK